MCSGKLRISPQETRSSTPEPYLSQSRAITHSFRPFSFLLSTHDTQKYDAFLPDLYPYPDRWYLPLSRTVPPNVKNPPCTVNKCSLELHDVWGKVCSIRKSTSRVVERIYDAASSPPEFCRKGKRRSGRGDTVMFRKLSARRRTS